MGITRVKSECALCDGGDLLALTLYMYALALFFLMTGPCWTS